MTARYVLTKDAARDLVDIWRYIKDQNSTRVADEVELEIRRVIAFLAGSPNAGHVRKDLT